MSNPLADRDTAFFQRVWDYVQRVPPGRVVSYGQVAKALPVADGLSTEAYRREGARLVGSAMAASPDGVPWHRVVNAKGQVSAHSTATRQQRLLEREGVCFASGQLDMARVQWFEAGRADALPQQSLF